jgi:protein SCO1/2
MRFTSVKKILILALILALPGFLYYLLTAEGKNRYKPLPIFGPKPLSGTFHKVRGKEIPDTLYHTVADFKLSDLNGNPVSFETFDKKIILVNFFYTGCQNNCGKMNANVDSIALHYAKNPLVRFISVTVDPDKDTPAALKAYAGNFKASPNWQFLTGDTSNIYNFARKGLLVDALQSGKDSFVFSDKIILLDSEHHVRGYYSGLLMDDLIRLNDEIKVMIAEELRRNDKPLY